MSDLIKNNRNLLDNQNKPVKKKKNKKLDKSKKPQLTELVFNNKNHPIEIRLFFNKKIKTLHFIITCSIPEQFEEVKNYLQPDIIYDTGDMEIIWNFDQIGEIFKVLHNVRNGTIDEYLQDIE